MAWTLQLPVASADPQVTSINIYNKPFQVSVFSLLHTTLLGPNQYIDIDGSFGDSYYITFLNNNNGLESNPSEIIELSIPPVSIELPTMSESNIVTDINIYKKSVGTQVFILKASVPLGTPAYTDPTGQNGDLYYITFLDSVTGEESQPGPFIEVATVLNTVEIYSKMVDPDGFPVSNCPITVELIHQTAEALTTGDALIQSRVFTTSTDNFGEWNLNIYPNDKIYPTGSFYVFKFYNGNSYKEILSTGGAQQSFSGLKTVKSLLQR